MGLLSSATALFHVLRFVSLLFKDFMVLLVISDFENPTILPFEESTFFLPSPSMETAAMTPPS